MRPVNVTTNTDPNNIFVKTRQSVARTLTLGPMSTVMLCLISSLEPTGTLAGFTKFSTFFLHLLIITGGENLVERCSFKKADVI